MTPIHSAFIYNISILHLIVHHLFVCLCHNIFHKTHPFFPFAPQTPPQSLTLAIRRKQSLVNQSTNPFVAVVRKLEQLSDVAGDITEEQIYELTEPLVNAGSSDDLMGLAKTTSRSLYCDLEPVDRAEKINILVSVNQ